MISKEFIRALPKTDLHVHLDGSLRLSTLIELAKQRNVQLPGWTEEELREKVFKTRYNSLEEYLQGFQYTVAVMQDEEALQRVAYEFAVDNFEEGVRYFEVRFAPQLHVNPDLEIAQVLLAVNKGLAKAKEEYNSKSAVKEGKEPPYDYGITVSALRYFDETTSWYYKNFIKLHRYTRPKRVFGLASLELAEAAVHVRDRYNVPITGLDLAGREKGYPADDHWEAFDYAHKNFLKKTVHAGEAYGPESIFQAITELHADRIGHGYFLLSPEMVTDPDIADPQKYVQNLAEYIADRRITVEVCLTSNMQTNPNLLDISQHAFAGMRKMRLSTTICTDNRLVSNTTVTDELALAVDSFRLTPKELKNLIIYGFKRSFFPGSYVTKRAYVRKIIDYYEQVAASFPDPGFSANIDTKDI